MIHDNHKNRCHLNYVTLALIRMGQRFFILDGYKHSTRDCLLPTKIFGQSVRDHILKIFEA